MIQTDSLQLTHQSLEFFSQKTKDRILISSLVLFNEGGFNNVTTASIAKHTGILEGTLWYHFNSKKDILSNHIQLLKKVFFSVNQQNKSKDFETIINEFFQSYNIIWDFRYILRDNFQKYFEDDKSITKTITDINNYLDKWAEKNQNSATGSVGEGRNAVHAVLFGKCRLRSITLRVDDGKTPRSCRSQK